MRGYDCSMEGKEDGSLWHVGYIGERTDPDAVIQQKPQRSLEKRQARMYKRPFP